MPDDPRWMDKKPKPEYVKHERTFAKDNGLRQTPSSGRRWFSKGDSRDSISGEGRKFAFLVDNKGTKRGAFLLSRAGWQALSKSARLTGRIPLIQVEFIRPDTQDGLDDGGSVVIMPTEEWRAMREHIEDLQKRISSDGDAGKAKGKPARADKRSSVRP